MCTAISDWGKTHLFGRTLDVEATYGESIVTTPRSYRFAFLHEGERSYHLAMTGVGIVAEGVPLYYDAINEAGLAMAGLNFAHSACYHEKKPDARNVASFELIPYVLSECKSVAQAKALLSGVNITRDSFSPSLSATPLHWIIADCHSAVTVESTQNALTVYENPLGVLTNEPPFPYHMKNICNYMALSPQAPKNKLCDTAELECYSRGMGALGLPGDFSSCSRFVRAVYAKTHTERAKTEAEQIQRFFHITDLLTVPRGCVIAENGKSVYTAYACCADTQNASYHVTTYACRTPLSVNMRDTDLLGEQLSLQAIY